MDTDSIYINPPAGETAGKDRKMEKMRIEEDYTIEAESLVPPHCVIDSGKYETLVDDMTINGWIGRPILVVNGAYKIALSGSHRIAAAQAAGIEVPVLEIESGNTCGDPDYEEENEAWEHLMEAHDDDDRLRALRELFALGEVPSAAVRLMELEVAEVD